MRYVSLFSGIEAASVAWEPLGWEPVAFSEIDPFPCAVLQHHYADVPNLGDITEIDWKEVLDEHGTIDLVVGGSPCQSFSIAGGREGLDGESRLMFEYIRAVDEVRPAWLLWENVPGVFSIDKGRAFGILIDALEEFGYGMAWRTLDAQFFGVAQRRRRVFLVGHLGDARAAAVLFDSDSVRGNTKPSREKRKDLARTSADGSGRCGGCLTPWDTQTNRVYGADGASMTLSSNASGGQNRQSILAFDTTQITSKQNGNNPQFGDACHTLSRGDAPTIAIQGDGGPSQTVNGNGYKMDGSHYTLNCVDRHSVMSGYRVRRLTPVECERLQGFPDGYTDIPYKGKEHPSDGPRYKALGNSMAVPVMRWIGERIGEMEGGIR